MPLETPIALIIFNRPRLVEAVFAAIAEAQPRRLFVVADGPRFSEEAENCHEARSVINRVDWNCEVMKNVVDLNLGCRQRVASGLDWVFSQADEAIILEDDCLPGPSFFRFCETLLDRYRHDERVMEIAGSNWQLGQSRTEYSSYFSKHSHTWGWATWKRAWQHYDEKLTLWPKLKGTEDWARMWDDPREMEYWESILDRVYEGEIDTWDYQWQFAMWCRNGLSAVPNVNLVSNIGFGRGGTHTTRSRHPLAGLPTRSLEEIRHPPSVTAHKEADKFFFEQFLWDKPWKRYIRKVRDKFRRMTG
jgi:hypothetical protein